MDRRRRLRWNPNNVGHILWHEVRTNEVQEVVGGDPVARPTYGGRIAITGLTAAGRPLTVVLEPADIGDDSFYYVVTARPASRRERARYRAEKGDQVP